jgi:class III poly(R)-hydroxyalkanoic acid synthase PhaE subunit
MTDSPTSLYSAWLGTLPEVFRAMVPAGGAPASPSAAAATAAPAPFPADQIAGAMGALEGILTQLYQGYLPLLAKGGLTADALNALAQAATDAMNRALATLASPLAAMPALGELAPPFQPIASLVQGLLPGSPAKWAGTGQLQLGIERTFGGLAEAFGLGPMRELRQAGKEMALASATKQRAQAEYLALVAQAFATGTQGLVQELQAMGARGERVESLLAFIRLWAKAVDAPLHETMQGEAGLKVSAEVIRASTRHRQQVQKAIGLASEALHMPTRSDMDAAFKEIQELKRELRKLKKALPAAAQKKLLNAKEPHA